MLVQQSHPEAISAFASASGLPHSAVMIAAKSSVAAEMLSCHLGEQAGTFAHAGFIR